VCDQLTGRFTKGGAWVVRKAEFEVSKKKREESEPFSDDEEENET